jgi:uncharacterized lipoprotein YddW (UPF0748 family)
MSAQFSPPPIRREFRGVWIATVANIDWPSRRGLSVETQKAQLRRALDRATELNLNAVVLQVRPACDALYDSRYEPWSEFLTGVMGKRPEPFYDPLAFAVEEAHRRGLELHAWFNPYRALHPDGKSPVALEHISRTRPDLVRRYGRYLWLDPGESAVQQRTVDVVLDVVRRYDVDGVHLDDYFYPYVVRDDQGRQAPFPDEQSWKRYRAGGGRLSRDDWRRENVNTLIRRLRDEVRRTKSWVRFGISPFGIWRPGNPSQIRGMDPYSELYADSRLWLTEGWVDYLAPQLYWPIDQTAQSFPVLLRWWTEQNRRSCHIWPGMHIGRVADGSRSAWQASEAVRQIEVTRAQPGASGNILFSMATLVSNRGKLADALRAGPYREPALVPTFASPGHLAPAKPALAVRRIRDTVEASWTSSQAPRVWTLQTLERGKWSSRLVPAAQMTASLRPDTEAVAVGAVDRCGNTSPTATWRSEE